MEIIVTRTLNAQSICEAEFIALAYASKLAIYPMQILLELGVDTRPFEIKEDNEACIKLVRKNVHFNRSKHILNRFFYVRQICDTLATVEHVESENQLADVFTKCVVPTKLFKSIIGRLMQIRRVVKL